MRKDTVFLSKWNINEFKFSLFISKNPLLEIYAWSVLSPSILPRYSKANPFPLLPPTSQTHTMKPNFFLLLLKTPIQYKIFQFYRVTSHSTHFRSLSSNGPQFTSTPSMFLAMSMATWVLGVGKPRNSLNEHQLCFPLPQSLILVQKRENHFIGMTHFSTCVTASVWYRNNMAHSAWVNLKGFFRTPGTDELWIAKHSVPTQPLHGLGKRIKDLQDTCWQILKDPGQAELIIYNKSNQMLTWKLNLILLLSIPVEWK